MHKITRVCILLFGLLFGCIVTLPLWFVLYVIATS